MTSSPAPAPAALAAVRALSRHQAAIMLDLERGARPRPSRPTRDALIRQGLIARGVGGQLTDTELGEQVGAILVARDLLRTIERKIELGDPGPTTPAMQAKLEELRVRAGE